jgi:hypothetical protein
MSGEKSLASIETRGSTNPVPGRRVTPEISLSLEESPLSLDGRGPGSGCNYVVRGFSLVQEIPCSGGARPRQKRNMIQLCSARL